MPAVSGFEGAEFWAGFGGSKGKPHHLWGPGPETRHTQIYPRCSEGPAGVIPSDSDFSESEPRRLRWFVDFLAGAIGRK